MRRPITVAAFVNLAFSVALIAQQDYVTFTLSDGDRMSGTVVVHTGAQPNIRTHTNEFSLKVPDGTEVPIPFDSVTLIDFVGGEPRHEELAAAPADAHLLTMRDGTMRRGRLLGFVRGNTVKWETARGAVTDIPIGQVRRIYLKADRARDLYRFAGDPAPADNTATANTGGNPRWRTGTARAPVASARLVEIGAARVDPRTAWTDTGIIVRRGEVLVVDPTGTIQFSHDRNHVTGPEGSTARAGREAGLPLPSAPVGSLIGRIGTTGAPFAIGAGSIDIEIPANGRLYLGVNDDGLGDNSGSYEVVVYR